MVKVMIPHVGHDLTAPVDEVVMPLDMPYTVTVRDVHIRAAFNWCVDELAENVWDRKLSLVTVRDGKLAHDYDYTFSTMAAAVECKLRFG